MQIPHSHQLFCFKRAPGSQDIDIEGFSKYGRQEISIRPGLWLNIINFAAIEPMCLEYKKKYPVIDFGFVISGNIKRAAGQNTSEREMHIRSGISGVRFAREQSGVFAIPAREEQQIVHLHLSLPFFREIMKREYKVLPPYLQDVMNETPHKNFSSSKAMPPDIQAVVYQILNASSNAVPWHLYLEGKILELLSLHLAALSIDHQKSDRVLLNPEEKKRIAKAKALLIRDLHQPPGLKALSAMTGLAVNKLQAGFRETYGKTVFDYFREHRMQTAKMLLEKTETNVSETAWQVGYVNVSHFSSAFKKRFGILPKQYLKTSLTNRSLKPRLPV